MSIVKKTLDSGARSTMDTATNGELLLASSGDTQKSGSMYPASGSAGAPVELLTVKALLTEPALSRVRAIEHRCCV